jgi:hypothetical protein
MQYRTARSKPAPTPVDPLERGQFSDGKRTYVVCASSLDAPDSFQVYAKGNRADVILIVSGLNTGNLHATWSAEWRALAPEWREWARTRAFQAFHEVDAPDGIDLVGDPRSGKVRFCNG